MTEKILSISDLLRQLLERSREEDLKREGIRLLREQKRISWCFGWRFALRCTLCFLGIVSGILMWPISFWGFYTIVTKALFLYPLGTSQATAAIGIDMMMFALGPVVGLVIFARAKFSLKNSFGLRRTYKNMARPH